MIERSRTTSVAAALLSLALFGCLCAPASEGQACSATSPCATGVCDTTFDGGYCTMPCNVPLGERCELTGDQPYGVCGLPLADGGMGCAQECKFDGGGFGVASCRSGYRCVAPPGTCRPTAYYGCSIGGICVP